MSETSAKFKAEKAAIEELRHMFPEEKQMTLAKRIRINNFSDPVHQALATKAGVRSRLSIYSVIRRYDADQKAKALAASELDLSDVGEVAGGVDCLA